MLPQITDDVVATWLVVRLGLALPLQRRTPWQPGTSCSLKLQPAACTLHAIAAPLGRGTDVSRCNDGDMMVSLHAQAEQLSLSADRLLMVWIALPASLQVDGC